MSTPLLISIVLSFLSLFSVFRASFPVESATAEVKIKHELTFANFSDSIKDGVWYIEFIAPFCIQCRKLKPTWQHLLAIDDAQHNPDISFAQVNCNVQRDLCQQQNIYGYPSVLTYEDGVRVLYELDNERLTKFIDAQTKALRRRPVPTYLPNPEGTVISLNSMSFQSTIDGGPTFVIFGVWCHDCKNTWLKRGTIWAQFALEMKGKATVAEVNCLEQREICRTDNRVRYYPTIHLYIHGQIKEFPAHQHYLGLEALKKFADAALKEPYIRGSRSGLQKATIYKDLAEPVRADGAEVTSQTLPPTQQVVFSPRRTTMLT